LTYESRQWSGQYVIAARPDGLGVCRVEAGDGTDKISMVCDDDDDVDGDDDDDNNIQWHT